MALLVTTHVIVNTVFATPEFRELVTAFVVMNFFMAWIVNTHVSVPIVPMELMEQATVSVILLPAGELIVKKLASAPEEHATAKLASVNLVDQNISVKHVHHVHVKMDHVLTDCTETDFAQVVTLVITLQLANYPATTALKKSATMLVPVFVLVE